MTEIGFYFLQIFVLSYIRYLHFKMLNDYIGRTWGKYRVLFIMTNSVFFPPVLVQGPDEQNGKGRGGGG